MFRTAAEIDSARQSVGRTCVFAKIVAWSSAAVLFALVYPFGNWFAGQLPPLAPDSNAVGAVVWVIQSVLMICGAFSSFVAAGLCLARWPFQEAIELNQALQPLEDFEAGDLVRITEAHPDLDEYRRSVAAVREFVKGDYELICDLQQTAFKLTQEAKREHARQAVFAKLHRVE